MTTISFAADYPDIRGHWAEPELSKWIASGILEGSDNRFRPDDPVTRGEMAVILDRLMKYQKKSENAFSDLEQDFYTDSILKANASGIINGDGKKVRPADNISREEAAVMLGRALGTGEGNSNGTDFSDKRLISPWAIGYVNQMSNLGYIKGLPDESFSPKADITRAEVIKIIDNAVKGFYNTAGTYIQNVNGSVVINTPGIVLKEIDIKGDLIIAEGVGNGVVTLNSVKVEGKTIVRGGGENSIIIQGTSALTNIKVERNDGVANKAVTIVAPEDNYTALGDSIAYGMNADKGKSYVQLYYGHLLATDSNTSLLNLSENGLRSSDLLSRLKYDPITREAVRKAKVITISIGGNDIMRSIKEAFAKAFNIQPKSATIVSDLSSAFADPANRFKVLSVIAGLQPALTAGSQQFTDDWKDINNCIKALAPDSKVYTMTVYNPLSKSDPMYNMLDSAIQTINTAIKSSSEGWCVVDVYIKFKLYSGEEPLTNFNLINANVDPHPTTKGHAIIYQAHLDYEDGN